MQGWLNFQRVIKSIKKKKGRKLNVIISANVEKPFLKIQYLFMIKEKSLPTK